MVILTSLSLSLSLQKLQCSPTSDGAAAVVVANEGFVRANGLQDQAVEIIGMSLTSDVATTFDDPISKHNAIRNCTNIHTVFWRFFGKCFSEVYLSL